MEIKIECKYDKLLPIEKVKPHPRNVNIHPEVQLKGLEIALKENSIRHPLIISNRSNQLVAGHARLLVMKSLNMKKVPVVYQGFDNEEKEFQFMVADNESQRKSWLDPEQFQINIEEMGLDNMGLENFGIFDELGEDIIPKGTKEKETTKDNTSKETPEEDPPPESQNNDVKCIHVYIEEDYDKVIENLEYLKKENEPTTYSKIFINALFHYRKHSGKP